MEVKEYIRMQIEGLDRGLKRATDGLKQKEIEWQPACGCNSIGLILFHIFRSEDSFINKDKSVFETGKWYQKLGLDVKEAGSHYTVDQVNAFPVPELATILEYGAAVRAATFAYLDGLDPADYNNMLKVPWGEMPLVMTFSFVFGHASQHIGEISYLRGLQRGMDK